MMANNEENDKWLSLILSAADKGRTSPDRQFLERLREQSAKEFEARSADRRTQSQTTGTPIWRMIMTSRITKLTAAAAIVIAALVVVGVYRFGGTIDGASIAWADVVKPILNARTAAYTMIIGEEGKAPAIRDMIMGSRIRRTVEGLDDVGIIDLNASRVLALDPTDKTATYIELKGLRKEMQNPLENLRNLITLLQENTHFVVEELGEREIDGRRAVGFRAKHPTAQMTIWADPETALPIRIESQEGQLHLIIKEIRFDIDLDESLFSMDVPEGYSQQQAELDLYGSTEQDFIEGLRIWAELLGDNTFPDDVSIEYYIKQAQVLEKRASELDISGEEKLQLGMKLQRHLLFIRFFKGEGKWHYAGKGVTLGDAETAIFWYRPKDSQVYRVIYGDLTVKEASPEDLPRPLPPGR